MKILSGLIILALLWLPVSAQGAGLAEGIEKGAPGLAKGIAKQAMEHPEVLTGPAAAHAGKHAAVPHIASTAPATSHALSAAIVTAAVAMVFIGLLVYDLTHPSGAKAFPGSTWDTCANAPWTGNLHDTCVTQGWLSH